MPEQRKVLVADDDVGTHEDWYAILKAWGYQAQTVADGDKALTLFDKYQPHFLLADLRMPKRSGLDLLRDIRDRQLDILSIIISGVGDIPDAVEALKLGAYDYLCKPIDPARVQRILKNLSDQLNVRDENLRPRRPWPEVDDLGALFGRSLSMRRVLAAIEQLAESLASVVITGESGTGKELAARTIHQLSKRRNAPFLGLNCAAIPETLMESELFGHVRGAFTGADRQREGCFELARHGTLLLDEITELRPDLQAKLLRVLEERKVRRLGATSEIDLDVRVLAASNRKLERAVSDGTLREDLFYRLNVFTIQMPSLCERADDLPLLVESFVQRFAKLNDKKIDSVDDQCLDALKAHRWPGNVRQLRNVIERACVLCRGRVITLNDLAPEFKTIRHGYAKFFQLRVGTSLDTVERDLISQTMEFSAGNKTRAAEILGIAPRTLYNKLHRYSSETKLLSE
jgi:DNA-binding NtrC family response regulator